MKKTKTKQTINPPPKKRGAPKGHRDATRPTPVPDDTKEVTAKICEQCGSPDLEALDSVKKNVI